MSRFLRLRLPRKVLYLISTVFRFPYFFSIPDIWSKLIKPSELYEIITYLLEMPEIISSIELKAA